MFSRELTNISILKSFIHLRYIDVSKNNLKDITPLSSLTHLLTLRADYNILTSAKLEEMPFLQVASFNFNKINSTEGVNHPMLEHLSLNSKYQSYKMPFFRLVIILGVISPITSLETKLVLESIKVPIHKYLYSN